MKIFDMDQNSYEWHTMRCGMPTASRFDQILTPKTLKPASNDFHYVLSAEAVAGLDADPWAGNSITDHGLESEETIAALYEAETGFKCDKVGFVTNDEQTIGCSPDRFVGDDGLLEMKAPLAKNLIKTYCEAISSGEFPTQYRLQVQGQLMITGRKWCDLALWHPAIGLKVIRAFPDLEIHAALAAQIEVVCAKRDEAILTLSGI